MLSSELIATTKTSPFAPRTLQITHVADMQNIKATVGQHDTLTARAMLLDPAHELCARQDFLARVYLSFTRCFIHASARALPGGIRADRGGQLLARHGRSATLHHHDAPGIIRDLRGLEHGGAGGQSPA